MKHTRLITLFALLLGYCVGADALRLRAEPTDELLRLVSDDVTFCIVVQKPREVLNSVWKGPLVESARKSPLGDAIRQAPELEQLRQLEKFLSQQLEIDFEQFFENCFGDAIVLAYRAGPPGQPELERGVILSWVRDPKLLAATMEKVDAAQKQSGELKEIRQLSHLGQKYTRRFKGKGADEFHYIHGSVLAFSSQEAAIHEIIRFDRAAENKSRVPLAARQLEAAGCKDAAAALWINPRSFDAELAAKTRESKGNEATFLNVFNECWKALDSVVLGIHVGQHLEFSLALDVQFERLPAEVRPLLQNEPAASALWASFPRSPLFAVAGRTDLPKLIEAIGAFLSPETQKSVHESLEKTLGPAFGKKFVAKIPELLGPDWGICVSRPGDPKQVFPDVVAAVRLSTDAKNAESVQNLMTGLDSLVTLFRIDYNSKHADSLTKKVLKEKGVEVQYLEAERGWPSGFKPAFGTKDGYLVLASNPQLILAFQVQRSETRNEKDVPLLRASFREWRSFLQERQRSLADFAKAEVQGLAEVEKQAKQLDMLLQFLDRFEIVRKADAPGKVRLSARLHFSLPLMK